jgi:hypothetical protein
MWDCEEAADREPFIKLGRAARDSRLQMANFWLSDDLRAHRDSLPEDLKDDFTDYCSGMLLSHPDWHTGRTFYSSSC